MLYSGTDIHLIRRVFFVIRCSPLRAFGGTLSLLFPVSVNNYPAFLIAVQGGALLKETSADLAPRFRIPLRKLRRHALRRRACATLDTLRGQKPAALSRPIRQRRKSGSASFGCFRLACGQASKPSGTPCGVPAAFSASPPARRGVFGICLLRGMFCGTENNIELLREPIPK